MPPAAKPATSTPSTASEAAAAAATNAKVDATSTFAPRRRCLFTGSAAANSAAAAAAGSSRISAAGACAAAAAAVASAQVIATNAASTARAATAYANSKKGSASDEARKAAACQAIRRATSSTKDARTPLMHVRSVARGPPCPRWFSNHKPAKHAGGHASMFRFIIHSCWCKFVCRTSGVPAARPAAQVVPYGENLIAGGPSSVDKRSEDAPSRPARPPRRCGGKSRVGAAFYRLLFAILNTARVKFPFEVFLGSVIHVFRFPFQAFGRGFLWVPVLAHGCRTQASAAWSAPQVFCGCPPEAARGAAASTCRFKSYRTVAPHAEAIVLVVIVEAYLWYTIRAFRIPPHL